LRRGAPGKEKMKKDNFWVFLTGERHEMMTAGGRCRRRAVVVRPAARKAK